MHISDATFVVTDTETTGTHQGARVIELAAVKVRGGKVIDTFQQLINPGQSIPGHITRLTGITTGMVFDGPSADAVLPRYLDFLGDGILVAHNLSFDRRMINGELARMGRPELSNRTLCSLRLARRLLYELSSKSLTALSHHFEIWLVDRHRAIGVAEATADVLDHLLSHYRFAQGTSRLDDLLEFQYAQYRQTRTVPANVQRIRREVLDELPRSPGVYFMTDENDLLLYVGKAKNLRARVNTYFTGIGAHGERLKKLVQGVENVTWRTTDTELDALLEESRLIKENCPRYNRIGRRYRSRPFLRFNRSGEVMELSVTTQIRDDGAEYYGPVTPKRHALQLVELLSHLFGIEEGKIECGGTPVVGHTVDVPTVESRSRDSAQRIRGFLYGSDRTAIDKLEAAMYEASEDLRFERARWFRDQMNRLDRLYSSLAWTGGPLHAYDAVLAQPFDEHRRLRLFVIRSGRIVGRSSVERPVTVPEVEKVIDEAGSGTCRQLHNHADRAVEEIRILLHWLRISGEEMTQVRWSASDTPRDIAERFVEKTSPNCAA